MSQPEPPPPPFGTPPPSPPSSTSLGLWRGAGSGMADTGFALANGALMQGLGPAAPTFGWQVLLDG